MKLKRKMQKIVKNKEKTTESVSGCYLVGNKGA